MQRMSFTRIAAILLLLGSLPAAADPLVLQPSPVAGAAVIGGQMIDVAARPDGRYLVVWSSSGFLFGVVHTADGAAVAAVRSLGGGSRSSSATRPRAAALADGRFVVAWVEENVTAKLWMRLVDADGAPLGSPTLVGLADATSDFPGSSLVVDLPALAGDENGVVTVAWRSAWRVRVRRFLVAGADLQPLTWPAHPGSEPLDLGGGFLVALAPLPAGTAVAYRAFPAPEEPFHDRVAVVVLDRDGRQLGDTRYFATVHPPGFSNANNVSAIRATADETGRFLVVWLEHGDEWNSEGQVAAKSDRIRGQRFAADGTPVGAVLEVMTGPSDPTDPLFALEMGDADSRPDGTWLLTWGVGRYGEICGGPGVYTCVRMNVDGDVRARVLAADGTPLGETLVAAGDPTRLAGGAAATAQDWVLAHVGGIGSIDAARVAFTACGDVPGALCLGNRFRLQVEWRAGANSGAGKPLSVSADTGAFWFFSPTNVEMVAKVLDGTGVNGKHWVFFASLTDVEFDLVVTDTATGAVKRYHNPQGTLASRADTGAFDGGASLAAASSPSIALDAALARAPAARAAVEAKSSTGACPAAALCLAGGRFVVTAKWRLENGEGAATPIAWTGETGTFWFFSPSNVELAVKVLDGRGVNGRFWVFYASLSDVDFDLEVLDTTTGARRTYHNPKGTMASRADVEAF